MTRKVCATPKQARSIRLQVRTSTRATKPPCSADCSSNWPSSCCIESRSCRRRSMTFEGCQSCELRIRRGATVGVRDENRAIDLATTAAAERCIDHAHSNSRDDHQRQQHHEKSHSAIRVSWITLTHSDFSRGERSIANSDACLLLVWYTSPKFALDAPFRQLHRHSESLLRKSTSQK